MASSSNDSKGEKTADLGRAVDLTSPAHSSTSVNSGDGALMYKNAGVDMETGDELVSWLQGAGQAPTTNPYGAAVGGIGDFAALFRPNFAGLEDPLIVSGTDGVGTKVLLALEHGGCEGLGIDLVAMCVNDVYTVGAHPLFFLDYFATGKLDPLAFKAVLTGIRRGLAQCGALLMGGETAELPGLYQHGHLDLAGFLVGVVDGKKRLGPQLVREGDALYAWPSSGFHSNGYSLIRGWLKDGRIPASAELIQKLLTPTRIYHEVPSLLANLGHGCVRALANITGGGISGNLPRVLPAGLDAQVNLAAIPTSAWMADFINAHGATLRSVEDVFNLGAGMIAVVDAKSTCNFEEAATAVGLPPTQIGRIIQSDHRDAEAKVVFSC